MSHRTYTNAAQALFLVALGATLYVALQPNPPKLSIDSWGDKFEHSLAFVTLTILSVASFPAVRLLRVGERLSFLGALIEVVQSIPALHRDCDILDWMTDTAAGAAVLAIIGLVRWHRRIREGRQMTISVR